MKHILIDARLYGPKHTGIGRYVKNLLISLTKLPDFSKYKFSLLVYPELKSEIQEDLGDKFNLISTGIRHYSFAEQLKLPFLLYRLKPDLVHFTHFNKPILYLGKSVITIHDLIKHFFKDPQATTRNIFVYNIKHFLYKLVVASSIYSCRHIIVPTNFWRDFIIKQYQISPLKITTTYEALDLNFKIKNLDLNKNYKFKIKNYLVYTGNLYPHKNIKIVIEALKQLPKLKLKIICARSLFLERLQKQIGHNPQVEFLGFVEDKKFHALYQNALAFVYPTLMEGFGLPGLEAMALNCPVISSNTSCLPEVYGDSVLYFDPHSRDDLTKNIKSLIDSPLLRQELINRGHQLIKKYSWSTTASQTIEIYQTIVL